MIRKLSITLFTFAAFLIPVAAHAGILYTQPDSSVSFASCPTTAGTGCATVSDHSEQDFVAASGTVASIQFVAQADPGTFFTVSLQDITTMGPAIFYGPNNYVNGILEGDGTEQVYNVNASSFTGPIVFNGTDQWAMVIFAYSNSSPCTPPTGGGLTCYHSNIFLGDSSNDYYTEISDTPLAPDTNTRIISSTPANGATIATTSAGIVGGSAYVNSSDYRHGQFIQLQLRRNSNIYQPFLALYNFPISSSGAFSFSTTTDLSLGGDYTINIQLRNPEGIGAIFDNVFSFFGIGAGQPVAIVSTTTIFTAASSSAFDILQRNIKAGIANIAASTTISAAVCNITSFQLGDCLSVLILPTQAELATDFQEFRDGFLSYAPWGYVTRLGVIFSGTATTAIPVISATFPLGTPGTSGYFMDTFYLDPNDMLQGGDNLLNSVTATFGPGEGMNFQQIFEPLLIDLFAVLLMMAMFYDMSRMRGSGKHHRSKLS